MPRPQLLDATEWTHDGYAYRAELSEYVTAPVCSASPDLRYSAELPDQWWKQLSTAMQAISAAPVPEGREPVISQDYVHRAVPRFVGDNGMDTTVHRWVLAHGDLHWANLTAPVLMILDWEGFGPAPYGFDAAHLHAYTLPSPDLAIQVHRIFADVLDTPEGRLAQIIVAAILLQAAERDPVHVRLAPHVRDHVKGLLLANPRS